VSNTDEIMSHLPVRKWVLVAIVCLMIPSLMLTSWGLEKFQKVVNDHSDKAWAADLELWIARCYAYTLRPEKASEKYQWAANLYHALGNDELAGDCLYHEAEECEAANKKWEAIPKYEYLADAYKDYPSGARAHNAVIRLKTMSRP